MASINPCESEYYSIPSSGSCESEYHSLPSSGKEESEYFSVPSSGGSSDSLDGRSFVVVKAKSLNKDLSNKKSLEVGSLCKGVAWVMAGVGIPLIYSVGSLWTLTYVGIKTFSQTPSGPLEHARFLGNLAFGASIVPPAVFLSICSINQFMEYCMDNALGYFSQSSLCK